MKPDYKALHAEAIGIPKDKAKDMSDEDQLKAHQAHMTQVAAITEDDKAFPTDATGSLIRKSMPPGPEAAVAGNAAGRNAMAQSLINDAMAHGMTYEDAFNQVRLSRPDLIPVVTNAENRPRKVDHSHLKRMGEVHALVNEKVSQGLDYDRAFSGVRRERPELFRS